MGDHLPSGPRRVRLQGFGYRHLIRDDWAIRNVDLSIEAGERVLLLGPSGAGKSTLLHAIAGLLDSETGDVEGSIAVDGQPPTPVSGGHGLSGTGVVFQDPDSQLVMSRSGDDVAFGLENSGVPADRIWGRVHAALDAVGFRYGPERATHALSGGEKQRLVLAGVLALRPGLLLLDEPTANLDPDGAELVFGAVQRTTADRSATVIMVEHRITRALPLVDRVVVIDPVEGVIASGPPQQVLVAEHDRLAAGGVWVDDEVPWQPGDRDRSAAVPLLEAEVPRRRHFGSDLLLPEPVRLTALGGRVIAVVGPNGAGKSTLASMLSGLAAPATGTLTPTAELTSGLRRRQAEQPIHRWRSERLAARIGTVFQNPEHQFLSTRVRTEITVGPRHSRDAYTRRADELLERLGLAGLAEANPYTLSGGEKRRLSVATALAGRPRVVIMDEPTFGQDRRTWIELARLLAELADEGTALVLVTHDQLLVQALVDRTVTLQPPVGDRPGLPVQVSP